MALDDKKIEQMFNNWDRIIRGNSSSINLSRNDQSQYTSTDKILNEYIKRINALQLGWQKTWANDQTKLEHAAKMADKLIETAQKRVVTIAEQIKAQDRGFLENSRLKSESYKEQIFELKKQIAWDAEHNKINQKNNQRLRDLQNKLVENDKKVFEYEKRQVSGIGGKLSFEQSYYKDQLKTVRDKLANQDLNDATRSDLEKQEKSLTKALNGSAILSNILSVATSIKDNLGNAINNSMNLITNYLGKVNSRLQGTNLTLDVLTSEISDTIGSSAIVSQETLLKNVATLTDSGIAYNLEQRALLETLSDKIVSTFDVLDASLTRLIRLQQADLTIQQMGVESKLLEFLNTNYQDSSYLNDVYDTVSSAILDANSQMNYQDTTEFNYAVQKWLSSLYELGMSSTGVTMIAEGLNALATGNVSTLNSNSSLTTLFGLASQQAGISYSDILNNGLNADNVNDLMRAMVTYLKNISTNTESQVTKAQWSNLVNLSVSDLRAIENLTSNDISTIYSSSLDYKDAMVEISEQFNQLSSRTSVAEQVTNVVENTLFTAAMGIAKDSGKYLTWKVGDFISALASNMDGQVFGTDLATAYQALASGFYIGAGFEDMVNALQSLTTSFKQGFTFEGFDASMLNARGLEWLSTTGGTTGVSYSAYTHLNGYEPIDTLAEQAETVATAIQSAETSDEYNANDLYKALIQESRPISVNIASIFSKDEDKYYASVEGWRASYVDFGTESSTKQTQSTLNTQSNT